MTESIFDKIADAKTSFDSNWVRPGRYQAEIMGVKLTQKFTGEKFLAIELRVVNVLDDNGGQGHRVGEDITHMLGVMKPGFLSNFKQFLASTLGVNPEDVTKEGADKAVSEEQPLAGIVVELEARTIMVGPNKDKPFTKVMYRGEVVATEDEA